MTTAIALHPEAVDGEPLEVRWVVPAGTLPFVGQALSVPEPLQMLVQSGVLTSIVIEPTAIRTRLAPDRDWRLSGSAVRDAVADAAAAPDEWVPRDGSGGDAVVRAAVEQVLAGEVGAYVRSHGGSLELEAVHEGVIKMRFAGACAHCPASDYTLTHRFEAAVRARCPHVVSIVTTRSAAAAPTGARLLGMPRFRSR